MTTSDHRATDRPDDPMARHIVEAMLTDIILDLDVAPAQEDDGDDDGEAYGVATARRIAHAVVEAFPNARMELSPGGLRRPELHGVWEVDPTATMGGAR